MGMTLTWVDSLIIVTYFVAVLAVGFYLKRYTKTGKDFFLAGREMTAWGRGAELSGGKPRLAGADGLGGSRLSIRDSGRTLLLDRGHSRHTVPGSGHDALLLHFEDPTRYPGYLKLRYGEPARALSAVTFAVMTVLMSGVNMYAMAIVMKVLLGWDINFSIWVSSITVAVYVTLGGLRSAIFNEVLQFILIWLGALLIPILGLIETGGWDGMVARISANFPGQDYTHLWSTMGSFTDNPMGIHWTGIVFGLGAMISFGYWTTDFLVVQRVIAAKNLAAAKMAPLIGGYFKMLVPVIVILPGLLGLALLDVTPGAGKRRHRWATQLQTKSCR